MTLQEEFYNLVKDERPLMIFNKVEKGKLSAIKQKIEIRNDMKKLITYLNNNDGNEIDFQEILINFPFIEKYMEN